MGPGALALGGQTSCPEGMAPSLHPPSCPCPCCFCRSPSTARSGGSGPPARPLGPMFTASYMELRGSAAAVGGDARFLPAAGWWEAGEPEGVINGISY